LDLEQLTTTSFINWQINGRIMIIQPSVSGLQAAFNNILQILREQYQIEYTSALLADNNSHNLAIGVTLQGALITASDNFTAQPGKCGNASYKDGQTVGGNVIFNPILAHLLHPLGWISQWTARL